MTLQQGLEELGIQASDLQVKNLQDYCELVRKWNKSFNLVSRQDIERLVSRHVLDSLTAAHLVEGGAVLDLGSGAGFPGIPLSIIQPDVRYELCDRLSRRTRFLHQVVNQLELDNVRIMAMDIKTLPDAQQYSTIVCRAVATADRVWDMVAPKLRSEGALLFFQSTQGESPDHQNAERSRLEIPSEQEQDEKRTANLPEYTKTTVHLIDVPGLDQPHSILQIARNGL